VSPKRPINADVSAPEEKTEAQQTPPAAKEPADAQKSRELPKAKPRDAQKTGEPPKAKLKAPAAEPSPGAAKRRQPRSATPKLLAGLVALALVFIVVAIVGSSGGKYADTNPNGAAPAPAPTAGKGNDDADAPQAAEDLGYPSFATNNTTRIGGSDPAANAAAVALAVFPSTTPAQRPAAVTLVDESDPARAIAAASLVAPPIRAPILFSDERAIPAATAAALETLDPRGSKATGGASVFSIGAVDRADLPVEGHVEEVLGARPTTFATAAAIVDFRERLAGPPRHIVIASLDHPEFAAPAAAWAARSGDPVLFVESKRLPPETTGPLYRHPKVPVYVLGPPSVISDGVLEAIAKISRRVKRVAGKTPAANAIALARYHDGGFGWNVNDPGHGFVLARAESPADAAAAAPLSASGTWGPLLLTEDAARLPDDLRSYFLDVKPGYTTDPTRAFYNHVWLLGDQGAIGVDQQAEVNELAELARIGGEG
jgi:hypothetical protein